ncbi:hypothetical protein NL676_028978 [Syzygium grande]|nr:hypothetical protein NL676_028978 [Syzygium grande]
MRALHSIPLRAVNNPASPSPPRLPPSDWHKLIIVRCIAFALPNILGVLMVIFLAIPALMQLEFGLNPGSSLSSLNVSTSHVTAQRNIPLSVKSRSKLIAVKCTHMKLPLNFGQLTLSLSLSLSLSRPSLVPAFTQIPGNMTTIRAKALSTLTIVNDLGVKGLVSTLKGGEVTIDVVAKANQKLLLGLGWVAVFDAYFSCMGMTFAALTDGEDRGDWMILGSTLSCSPDINTQLW